jgi:sec-independent protein translocase protein TatA
MPFRIEATDVVLIILAAMILFGGSRLPEIGRSIGKAIVEFRRGYRESPENAQETMGPVESTPPGLSAMDNPGEAIRGNFCTQCGAPNPADARYCSHCGQLIQPGGESFDIS